MKFKHLFLMVSFLVAAFNLQAQTIENTVTQETNKEEPVSEIEQRKEEPVYTFTQVAPQFQGGEGKMQVFIMKNLKYPESAVAAGIVGKVWVKFVINKDSTISDIAIVRGLSNDCDKEVIRVIKLMPKWSPGMMDGKPVRCSFTLPVSFMLKSKEGQ